jgi:sortase (surface protein transpeptidase)
VPFREWVIVSVLVAIAGVVLSISALGGQRSGPPIGKTFRPTSDSIRLAPSPPTNSVETSTPAPRPHRSVQQPRPVHIQIPAIGVSAPVIRLGLNPDRTMETPNNYSDTGWYAPGPEPGEPGAAVIAGHVDSKAGPGVFFRLGQLRRGNVIRIKLKGGRTIRFTVTGLERWPKSQFPTRRVFSRTRNPTLRLITCGGAFDSSIGHYVDDTIVYGVLRTAGKT